MRASGTGNLGTPPSETLIWYTCGCVIPMLGAHCTKIRSPVRFSSAFPLLNFFVYHPESRHDTVGLNEAVQGGDSMRIRTVARVVMCAALVTGCVSTETHNRSLTELEETRRGAAQTAAAFERFKKQAAAEADSVQKQFADANTQIAVLMRRAGELEAETARANDLAKRLEERLKAEAAEKARLEQERAAKEAEIQRLTRTHEELTKSLQAEIAKGNIKIKQVRDRLTINMVDRVLFDSGQSQVKPAGLQVLKQVSDILKNVTDQQIRIEGHTDNVPIGAKLKGRFPTNWNQPRPAPTTSVGNRIKKAGLTDATFWPAGKPAQ